MPLKTWAPYERLTATDLNAAFAWATNHPLPGVICGTGVSTSIPMTTGAELKPAAPAAADDPLGFWNPGTSRLVVPPGLGGLYLAHAQCSFTETSGSLGGDPRQTNLMGFPMQSRASVIGSGTTNVFTSVTAIGNLAQGGGCYVMGYALETAPANGICWSLTLVRIGPALGAVAAALEALAELEAEQPEIEPGPEPEPLPWPGYEAEPKGDTDEL